MYLKYFLIENIEQFSTTGFNVSQIFYKLFEENNEQISNITEIEFDNHNNTYFFKDSKKISLDSREFLKLYFVYQDENSKNISIQIDKILFETSKNNSKQIIFLKACILLIKMIQKMKYL